MTCLADVVLYCTLPPSSNRIWRVAGNRVHKSAEYRTWRDTTAARIREEAGGDEPIGWCSVVYSIPHTRRDLGNAEKPLSDMLQAAGIIADDKFIVRARLELHDPADPLCAIRVYREAPPDWLAAKKRRKRA